MEILLRKVGLTEGEIKVYKALLKLKKSSVGPIIKTSKISASKVYVVLDRLLEKGLASYIVEENIKQFSPTNPKNILEYLDKKEKEIQDIKKESKEIINQISQTLGTYKEESAQIYTGLSGLKVAYDNILDELDKDDPYLFFSVSDKEFSKAEHDFFLKIHQKRKEKKVKSKGILQKGILEKIKEFRKMVGYEVKEYKLSLPHSITIGKKRVLITMFEEKPWGVEIISERLANRYKDYFYKLWNKIK